MTHRDERGAVIPIVALSLVFLMAATALSVDIGRLAARTRELQSVADLAALDGARLLDGSSEASLYAAVEAAVVDSAARNGFFDGVGRHALALDLGCFDRSTAAWDTACDRPDAVQVETTDTVPFYFQAGSRSASRAGVARRDPVADFSIGSLLAGISPTVPSSASVDAKVRILDATLDAFLQVGLPDVVDVDLDLVGYRGLATASLLLDDLAAELGFASPEELLASSVRSRDVVVAMVTLLDRSGHVAAADALDSFATDVDASATMALGRWIELASGHGAAAAAAVNALDLLVGGAQVIDGVNFVDTAFAGAVGPARVADLRLTVVEHAVRRQGRAGDSARTAQMRASLVLTVPLELDLGGGLTTVDVRLPMVVEMAAARALVTGISCREPVVDSETAMRVSTDAFRIHIGETADLTADDPVITQASLIDGVVSGGATFTLAGHQEDIDPPFIGPYGDHNRRRVYGHGGPSATAGLLANLTTTLGPTFTSQLQGAIAAALPDLDAELLDPLLEIGGVGLGGADVTAHGLDCSTPLLVG